MEREKATKKHSIIQRQRLAVKEIRVTIKLISNTCVRGNSLTLTSFYSNHRLSRIRMTFSGSCVVSLPKSFISVFNTSTAKPLKESGIKANISPQNPTNADSSAGVRGMDRRFASVKSMNNTSPVSLLMSGCTSIVYTPNLSIFTMVRTTLFTDLICGNPGFTLFRLDVMPSSYAFDAITGVNAIIVRPSSYGYSIGRPMHLSKFGMLARLCRMLHSLCTDSLLLFQLTLIAIFS